jgi:hypothetical protein
VMPEYLIDLIARYAQAAHCDQKDVLAEALVEYFARRGWPRAGHGRPIKVVPITRGLSTIKRHFAALTVSARPETGTPAW